MKKEKNGRITTLEATNSSSLCSTTVKRVPVSNFRCEFNLHCYPRSYFILVNKTCIMPLFTDQLRERHHVGQ